MIIRRLLVKKIYKILKNNFFLNSQNASKHVLVFRQDKMSNCKIASNIRFKIPLPI